MNIQINTQGYPQNQVGTVSDQPIHDLATLKQELQLSTGQVLSGRIMEMEGNSITLLLDGNRSVSAQLSGNLNVSPGQMLSFEVKSTAGNTTELRPLYTNLAHNSTIASALNEASLPATERNISMVHTMMEEGMSVNKQALLDMVSGLNSHPDVGVETLVHMTKLGLPLDEATIHQFENYENFEHQILKDVTNLTDGLSALSEELFVSGDENGALKAGLTLLDMAGVAETEETMVQNALTDANPVSNASEPNGSSVIEPEPELSPQSKALLDGLSELKQMVMSQSPAEDIEASANRILAHTSRLINQVLNNPNGNNSALTEQIKATLKDVMQDDTFKQTLSGKLSTQFMLKPEDVGKEGKIQELYQRILEHSARATELVENTTGNQQTLQAAQNLNDNVNFMNQMSEMLTYVQLPLKMSQENAHGDLYVYTNKKKLAEKDGNYSALLHLDMDRLGPMDVYVALNQQKVSTHFYMKDEDTLSFIEANIHLLNERLTKKGYQMNTSVTVKEPGEMKSMAETFLSKEEGSNPPPTLSTFSFDVRA